MLFRSVVNPGLAALMKVCELDSGRVLTPTDVAFRIAPRMNAAGRMDVARDVVELFTVKDAVRAGELAARLDELNTARQKEEQRISETILQQVAGDPELREAACMVVAGEGWHRGVIGICASRVVDAFHRPALVISYQAGEAHGSGRSVAGFHLLDALESTPELFTRFGGHAHAVGFAMPEGNIPELRRRLNAYAALQLPAGGIEPAVEYDGELALDEVTPRFWESLRAMQPFGLGNPEPVFRATRAVVLGEPRVMREKHLKLKLRRYTESPSAGLSRGLDALGWRMAHRLASEPVSGGDALDILFRIEQNTHPEFGGSLQLVLSDFQRSERAVAASTAL